MAITLVTTLVGATASDGTRVTISVPSSTCKTGDIIIFSCASAGAGIPDDDVSASADASGPLFEIADLYAADIYGINLWAGYAIQGSTPDTTISVPSTRTIVWILRVYRGVDIASVLDLTSVTDTGTSSDTADGAALTPVTYGSKVVVVYAASQDGAASWVAPANINNFRQASTGRSRIAMGDADWTSGAFDPDPVTGGAGATTVAWAAVTLALRPTPTLVASLLANSQTFYAPTIHSGGVTLTAGLLTDTQSFYSPTVVSGLSIYPETLFIETQIFPSIIAIGPNWLTSSLGKSGWAEVRPGGIFDGAMFDIDIFDGLAEFAVSNAADANWLRESDTGIFDGHAFDISIFDGIETFERQASPDPNWTRVN